MATWIIHLRIAEKLYKEFDCLELDKIGFYLGNIAIDSGKVNDDLSLSPPRYISHWFEDSTKKYGCRYKDFFQTFLNEELDIFSFSFYLGCVAHLITDNIWYQKVVQKTKDKYRKELNEDYKFILQPKKDWYDVDCLFIRDHPNFEPLDMLSAVKGFKNIYLPWFDEDSIQLKLDELLEFYKTIPNDIDRDYLYFNSDEMENFVDYTVLAVKQELLHLLNIDNIL